MKRRVIVSAAVLVGVFAMAVVLRPTHNQPKDTRHTDKSTLTASTSSQAEKSIFSILGSVSPALAPSVTTNPATNLNLTSVTLNGTVLTAGSSPITTRGFEYGLTDSYGETTTENVPESFEYVSKFGSASNGDGELYNPYGVAIDSSGDVYVADTTNDRIQKFNSSGVYQSQFGSGGSGDGQFTTPRAIAIDAADNIYVADPGLNRIQKFNSSGVYQSQFGSGGSGNGQFNHPYAIAIDSSNNVYVSDRYNHRIQKFNSSGVYQSQFGSGGSGDGQFNQPGGMVFDSADNAFVVDQSNSRIQKFNSSGVYQSKFGSGGTGNGNLSYPIGIALDSSEDIYVLERNNNRIQKFNSSGVYQSKFGVLGSGDGQFSYAQGIAIDSSDNIYASDGEDHRVQKFNSSGVFQLQFGHDADNDQLYGPASIVSNSSDQLLVVDAENHQVNIYNSSGVYQSQFGSYGSGNGQFNNPIGLAVDSAGNIYVADTYNSRVQKFNSSGVYQSQFGSYGSGNGQFGSPQGIAVDSTGNIYVADTNSHRVQKFNSSGVYQSQFGTQGTGDGQFNYPEGIAIDSADDVYIVDGVNHRIQKFNSSGVYQSQFGSVGNGNGQFNYPNGIDIDSLGNIYVADQGNERFQKFNSSGVYQSKYRVNGVDGSLYQPRGLAVDGLDAVHVINGFSNVKKYVKSMHEGDFSANLTGLTCNTTYHYRAYASNDDGPAQGTDATFTTLACPVLEPGPPTNLSASASSSSAINISWDEPVGTGDSPIANYTVYYRKTGDIVWLSDTTPNSTTAYTLGGLDSDTQYDIKITARNTNDHLSVDSAQVTATTDVYVSPYPDPPTNLQATISSSTSIDVSWDAPVNTGDSPITYYYLYYQQVGESSWELLYPNNGDTSRTIAGLRPSTQYSIKVVAENSNNKYSADSEIIVATTATPGVYLITNCQQFQDIQNDLAGNYELARNIDCSDTINWNSGAGFQPIGNFFIGTAFSGVLAGNNYTISDLYINQQNQEYAFVAPFGSTNGALIQDVRIVRPNISASSAQVGVVAGLIAYDANPTSTITAVNNVHIINAALQGEGEQFAYVGGLIGASLSSGISSDSNNEFRGTINIDGSIAGAALAGGLYGLLEGGTRNVDNSYANANITINNTYPGESVYAVAGGLLGGNGLNENSPTQTNFNHSYAAGSITHNSAQPTGSVALGGLVGVVTRELSVSNSFARNSLTNLQPGVFNGIGGIIAGIYASENRTYTNNYFDADVANTTDCIDPSYDPLSGCTPISGQPNYFYDNSINSPLNTWDFDNIWQTTSTLPVFGKKVLTSTTAIPASRLPGYAPPAGTVFPQATDAPTVGPVVSPKLSLRTFGGKFLPPAENTPTSLIERLRQFFKNVPEVVLVAFPYAFFSLLLIGALALLVEVWLQAKRLSATKLLIARQEAVAKERDTFWHLAANYLRAPITLMVGGIELLSDDKFPGVAKLQLLSANLQAKVGTIMERIEDSKSLQDIARPKAEAPKRALSLVRFWAPVVAVGMLAVAMNVVATSYRNINLSLINLGMQVMIFVIVSLLLYWVLGALGVVSSKRKQAEALLKRQAASLDGARSEFIAQSATDLDKDLAQLQHELDGMHAKAATGKAAAGTAAAMAIVSEGAHRLRDLIDSFELLVAAQNNKLGQLSPQNARTDLHSIVSGALVPLQPVITEKHLTIHTGTMNNMVVPGNNLLLNQVVGSVLSNAVAFSPAGSTIELSLKQAKGSVQLVVTNQGTPISKDEISHVFSPLTKADGYDGLQLDHDGLGVNLYIDKLIMEHLGGGIHVASSATKGTTMTMQWPMTQAG